MSPMPPKCSLFITADDFGVHDVIDNGIIDCIEGGQIDCVDCIVTGPESEIRIRNLLNRFKSKIENGELFIGLHLVLTIGTPQHSSTIYDKLMTQIDDSGNKIFKYTGAAGLIRDIHDIQHELRSDFLSELQGQYDRFIAITKGVPSHISSHLGVYQGTAMMYLLYEDFCIKNSLRMRCPKLLGRDKLKKAWSKKPSQKLFPVGLVKKFGGSSGRSVVKWISNEISDVFNFGRERKPNGLISTDHFVEHYFRNGKEKHLKNILNKLDNEIDSFEMVVHPVKLSGHQYTDMMEFVENELRGLIQGINDSPIVMQDRYDEYKTLLNFDLAAERERRGIKKIDLGVVIYSYNIPI